MNTDSIQRRFDDLLWHDSQLLSFSTRRSDGKEFFAMNIQMAGGLKRPLSLVNVVLVDVAYLEISIDLDAKRQLADTISSGYCVKESAFRKQVESKLPRTPGAGLEGYLQFHLTLLPPAGQIDAFARDFNVELDVGL